MRKFWNYEELELLKKMYVVDGLAPIEIANKMNRSIVSIKIKIQRLGLKQSPELLQKVRSRMSSGKRNGMFGKVSNNRGLTKENSERIRGMANKNSLHMTRRHVNGELNVFGENNGMHGKIPWNFGLTINTSETIKLSSEKQSLTKKQRWLDMPEDSKDVIRKKMARMGALCKKKDTSIEVSMRNFLNLLNIDYVQGYADGHFVYDFFIKSKNIVIECNGDYWHANPIKYKNNKLSNIQKKNIDRDKRKAQYIRDTNKILVVFWETDIKRQPTFVINELRILFDIYP